MAAPRPSHVLVSPTVCVYGADEFSHVRQMDLVTDAGCLPAGFPSVSFASPVLCPRGCCQVIGGVVLASVKELDFAWSALFTACAANLFAAFKVPTSRARVVSSRDRRVLD